VADWDDVRRLALTLPETAERESRGNLQWVVKSKLFVWERPLRKSDLLALGAGAPEGPVLGVMVADLHDKEALISEDPSVYFTTPHFDGYAAVLVQLDHVTTQALEPVVVEAWLARAPKRLASTYLDSR
jgi:hypothetical protein